MQTHAKQLTKMPSQHSLLGNLLTGHVDNQTPSPLGLLTDGLGQDDQYLDDGQNERRVVPTFQDEGQKLRCTTFQLLRRREMLRYESSSRRRARCRSCNQLRQSVTGMILPVASSLEAMTPQTRRSSSTIFLSTERAGSEAYADEDLLDLVGGVTRCGAAALDCCWAAVPTGTVTVAILGSMLELGRACCLC